MEESRKKGLRLVLWILPKMLEKDFGQYSGSTPFTGGICVSFPCRKRDFYVSVSLVRLGTIQRGPNDDNLIWGKVCKKRI